MGVLGSWVSFPNGSFAGKPRPTFLGGHGGDGGELVGITVINASWTIGIRGRFGAILVATVGLYFKRYREPLI